MGREECVSLITTNGAEKITQKNVLFQGAIDLSPAEVFVNSIYIDIEKTATLTKYGKLVMVCLCCSRKNITSGKVCDKDALTRNAGTTNSMAVEESKSVSGGAVKMARSISYTTWDLSQLKTTPSTV